MNKTMRLFTLALAVIIALGNLSAFGAAVIYKDGKLQRASVPRDWQENIEDAVLFAKPCNYGEHEAVLGPIVNAVRQRAPGYEFSRIAKREFNVDGTAVACGYSAQKMVEYIRELNLLPEGWRAVRVDSNDMFQGMGGTSHTAYMIEAPDGTAYLMDSYFYGAEIMKMQKMNDVFYQPAEGEENHLFASKGYVQLWGNYWNEWCILLDDYAYYNKQDKSKGLLKKANASTSFSSSCDPNDIYGPAGVGDARYVKGTSELLYTIAFENVATAAFSAVDVRVDGQLDPAKMDLSSIRLEDITFGATTVEVPDGLQAYTTTVDLRPAKNLLVKITVSLDSATGVLRWLFNTLDPDTLEVPEDIYAGFLPPNATPPEGEGSVSFAIRPRTGVVTGDALRMYANIYFDLNDPIATPTWINTVDATVPASQMQAPSGIVRHPEFDLQWTSADEESGVTRCDVFVAVNGSDFLFENAALDGESLSFAGEAGKTYAFYSVAEDAVGNREATPSAGQITVTVAPTGDINLTLDTDAVDVQLVINAVLGLDIGGLDADIDGDGDVDAVDVQLVINAALGMTR